MKHSYSRLLSIIAFTLLSYASFSQSVIYESYAILDINGAGNVFYDLNFATANPDFNGANLGTFTPSNSLILNGAENKTQKCGPDNILNGWLNYRIYLISGTAPAFSSNEILYNMDLTGAGPGCLNQRWLSSGASIDVLNGLASGDYYLEVYTHADVDTDSDNILDYTIYANNGAANYLATFRKDDPPVANCQNITIQLDGSGNASITGSDIDNISTDDFGIASLVASQTSFTCADLGPNNITLTVTDSIGQTDTCNAVVTVEDGVLSATAAISVTPAALICQGDSVTFTATGTNLGLNPQYEWYVGGLSVGNNSATYTTSGLNDGEDVYVEITSTSCSGDVVTTSNSINMTVNEPATAEAGPDQIMCANSTLDLVGIAGGGATTGSWAASSGGFVGNTYYPSISNGIVTVFFITDNPPGPCGPATDSMQIRVYFPYFASASNLTTINDCSDTTLQFAGTSTGPLGGQWSAVSVPAGSSFSFSNINDPDATFTGESGSDYDITWTTNQQNGVCAESDSFSVSFPACGDFIDFDGSNDYINFEDNNSLSGTFSVETWIKPNSINGSIQTILSKRAANDLTNGYDLRLVNNTISFRPDGLNISYTGITSNRWYHVAVTYNGTVYRLYVDGILRNSAAGSVPTANSNDMLLGATSRTNGTPLYYFNGWMDEVRFWNTALSIEQIQEMMNQEIEDNTAVRGSVLELDIAGLNWGNLDAYYQMNQGTANIAAGFLVGNVGVSGRLSNITSLQEESAPLPYVSANDGDWDTASTWLNGSVQMIPNTNSVNWNIVRTGHIVNSGNRATSLLGLFVDSNTYSITDDQSLQVSKYLKIDGTLDLVGESQLLQDSGSIVDYSGSGALQRDQQGTTNLYGYNYWSSPVGTNGSSYNLSNSLHDTATGINPLAVQWTDNYDANSSTSPITLSRYWLFLYENYIENSYASWNSIDENSNIAVGLGYTMKGSGNAGLLQDYTFVGQPNNGTITSPVSGGFQALLGNPYPSALDAHAFINDNSSVLLDGALYFWEHSPTNATHFLAQYEGGYAYVNLTNGVPAASPPEINGVGAASKIPRRYVPVGQGFFVTGNASGGIMTFNNDQRAFVRESGGNSIFMRNTDPNNANIDNDEFGIENKYIRIDFVSPENAVRHLLIGFMDTDLATDGVDYGYDALNNDNFPDDMSFNIDDEKYIIQGVGNFDETKAYPLDIDLTNGGTIEIQLADLENFENDIDVFIYDTVNDSYTRFNEVSFQITLEEGKYNKRFFLVFNESPTLSTSIDQLDDVMINYLQVNNEIFVKTPSSVQVKQLHLINMVGQTVASWDATILSSSNDIRIPVSNISEGNYILKVETNYSTYNKKVVIKM